jgi:hypothetical protein
MRIFILDKVMIMINYIIYIIYVLFFKLLDCIIIRYFCLLFCFEIILFLQLTQYLVQFRSIQEFILLLFVYSGVPDLYLNFQNLAYYLKTSADIN